MVFHSLAQPTLAATNASVTTTNAATLYIDDAPAAGTNQTITNAYALWIDDGITRLDGALVANSTATIEGATIVDVTGTEALLVRVNADAGDVFTVDTTNQRVGIGGTPSAQLHLTPPAISGTPALTGAHLRYTGATFTDNATAGSGTATNMVFHSLAQPTLAATNATITTTNAATLYIDDAPAAGTNQTITNAYALWVDDGITRLDGALVANFTATIERATIVDVTNTEALLVRVNADAGDVFTVDTTNQRVGIGGTPSAQLHLTPPAISGTPALTGAHLRYTGATFTDNATAGSGTATNMVFHSLAQPTLAATNLTVTTTNAATLYIDDAPAAGTNQTITNAYALWIDDGITRLDGALVANSTATIEGATIIDVTKTEALLVRVNADAGDVFTVDTTNQRVGIGGTPSAQLHLTPPAISGTPALTGAHLRYTGATFTDNATAGSGTATNMVFHSLAQPTLAATNLTVTTTNAATLYIDDAPAAGTNQTITNAYALWVDDGITRLDGALVANSTATIEGATIVDVTGTEALLVRVNADAGDVFTVDTTNQRVGIGGAPSSQLHLTPPAISGTPAFTGAHLRYTGATFTDNATAGLGTATNMVFHSLAQPTLAATNASVTTTNAATLYIDDAPAAGTNQTITNAYALWVDDGITRLDAALVANSTATIEGATIVDVTGTEALLVRVNADAGDVFTVDTTNQRVGIGGTPSAQLHLTPPAISGTPALTGAHLRYTGATFTDNATAGSGTATDMVFHSLAQPTLAATNASVTTTNAATLYIDDAPAAGTNQTITNAYALWIDDGITRLDGALVANSTATIEGATIVDVTGTEALLVRVNADAGDVFTVDTTNQRVGIGGAPSAQLHLTPPAISGTPALTGAHLRYTGATFTDNATAGSGTATDMVFHSLAQPTLAATNTSVTTTNAATLYIDDAPAAGTNQTITNAYALWVDDGITRLDGALVANSTVDITGALVANSTATIEGATIVDVTNTIVAPSIVAV